MPEELYNFASEVVRFILVETHTPLQPPTTPYTPLQVAQIASAIEAAATAQRLLLPAADAVQLRTQVALALRRGEALGAAAAAAVAGWHKKALRRQVQQTVWNHASWRGHTLL